MTEINNISAVPGLNFRLFRGENDYPHLASVLTASENADQTPRDVTAADLARAFQNLGTCDPYRDIVIAEVDGEVVGYARGWWQDDPSDRRLYLHNVFLVPEWRRKGIGSAMLHWIETRLTEIARLHPPAPARFFQVNVSQFQQGKAVLLARSGYQPVHHFFTMLRPDLDQIPVNPLPAGLEVRPATPGHYRQIWEASDEASQEEWGYKPPTEDDYREWLASPQFQPELWQVAWDVATGQVAGQVLTYIHFDENEQFNRRRGYTEGIGVRRSWRRRGLARALISLSLQAQKAAGMTESALVVDADSMDATRLYESCGFKTVKRDTLYRKPL